MPVCLAVRSPADLPPLSFAHVLFRRFARVVPLTCLLIHTSSFMFIGVEHCLVLVSMLVVAGWIHVITELLPSDTLVRTCSHWCWCLCVMSLCCLLYASCLQC